MRLALALVLFLTSFSSQRVTAQELSQGELRNQLLRTLKRDFATHLKNSGLIYLVRGDKVPMNFLDREFRELADKRFDSSISTLEAKMLVRVPKHIPRVKLIHKLSYDLTERICQDTEAEGNETDSARHFIAAFALSLLAGEEFAYKYLTAHEGWILDHNLDEYTGYNFASGLMDLHNNVIGLLAARKYQKTFRVLNIEIELHAFSLEKIKMLAIKELKQARKQNKLIAVYAKDGACSQVSQRNNFRSRLGLSLETPIY